MGAILSPRQLALYDTNILIDYLNGVTEAEKELAIPHGGAISTVTWMEVMAGVPSGLEAPIRSFLATFTQLAITVEVAEKAVQLRRATRIKLPDAIILATAQANHRLFVTRNTRDFQPGEGIRIPYRR